MNKENLIKEIKKKKEFSKIPEKDIEKVFEKFNKEKYLDEEKVKLSRDLLRKVFSGTLSQKILSLNILNKKNSEDILKKHLSTRERFDFYEKVYSRILKCFEDKKISVIDLGCGINGLSYNKFQKLGFDVSYFGVEAVGQLVDLMNEYFKSQDIFKKANASHHSLFDLEEIKKIISKSSKPRIVFLFKVLDSLEMIEWDYSKKLLQELKNLGIERFVVSFATESYIKRKRFNVNRNWILDFIKENFSILEDFELGGERYIVFE
jgi:hypothetical protein